jgi:hypothetical protein
MLPSANADAPTSAPSLLPLGFHGAGLAGPTTQNPNRR